MSFSVTVPRQQLYGQDLTYGRYLPKINSVKTALGYGVNSKNGYTIRFSIPSKDINDDKIKAVLLAVVDLEIAEENIVVRKEKFNNYVAWQPEENWANEVEYHRYIKVKSSLEAAQVHLKEAYEAYGVISVSTF